MKLEIALILLLATLAFGSWLTTMVTALNHLTWGMVRRLDTQKKRVLQEKAEGWIFQRRQFILAARGLGLLNLSVAVVAMVNLCEELSALGQHAVWAPLIGAIIFIGITELAGVWLGAYIWPVLQFSMPVLKILRILPGFFLLPAIYLLRQHGNNSEGDDEQENKPSTEEEIEALLDQDNHSRDDTHASNGFELITGRMIRGILDLDETLVKEIMTPRVDMDAIGLDADIASAKRCIMQSGHSRIPVYGKDIDDILGVVYSKDLLDAGIDQKSLKSVMHKAIFIPETKCVDDLLQEFKQSKVHIALVIDEYGGTAGLVSLEDILEEIVGEIADEFDEDDEEERPLTLANDGSLTLDARTPIDDVNDALDLSLPEEDDSVTIGGYIAGELGRIPKAGENLVLENLEIEVLTAEDRRLGEIRLRVLRLENGPVER